MHLHVLVIHIINSGYFVSHYQSVCVHSGNLSVYCDVSTEFLYYLPGIPLSVCEVSGTVSGWLLTAEAQVLFQTNTLSFVIPPVLHASP